jgi:hypothetical protein
MPRQTNTCDTRHAQLCTYLLFHGDHVPVGLRWEWLAHDPSLSDAITTVASFRRRRTPAPLTTATDALDPRGSPGSAGSARAV